MVGQELVVERVATYCMKVLTHPYNDFLLRLTCDSQNSTVKMWCRGIETSPFLLERQFLRLSVDLTINDPRSSRF